MYFTAYRLWVRFRAASWQRIAGLVPVTVGLVIASGPRGDGGWQAVAVTLAAPVLILLTWLDPF
jgi:hypothetical protein